MEQDFLGRGRASLGIKIILSPEDLGRDVEEERIEHEHQTGEEEIKNTIRAYLARNSYGEYEIPVMGQRPVLLMGPPGIGKTQIMEQVARECGIGLVAYTITHHTRQSAIGLPFISEQTYWGKGGLSDPVHHERDRGSHLQ